MKAAADKIAAEEESESQRLAEEQEAKREVELPIDTKIQRRFKIGDRFRGTEPSADGTSVIVTFKAGENFTKNMSKQAALKHAVTAIKEGLTFYPETTTAKARVLDAYQDEYGNVKERIWFEVELPRSEYHKANWDNLLIDFDALERFLSSKGSLRFVDGAR